MSDEILFIKTELAKIRAELDSNKRTDLERVETARRELDKLESSFNRAITAMRETHEVLREEAHRDEEGFLLQIRSLYAEINDIRGDVVYLKQQFSFLVERFHDYGKELQKLRVATEKLSGIESTLNLLSSKVEKHIDPQERGKRWWESTKVKISIVSTIVGTIVTLATLYFKMG